MRATTLLRKLLGLKHTKVMAFAFEGGRLVVDVAPTTRTPRCHRCCRRCHHVYDQRSREWRHLDFAGLKVVLRYRIRRVDCPCCGVQTELVPWASPGSWFTYEFEDQVACLAQQTNKTTITELMRISWATVGAIVTRVVGRRLKEDLLDGLERIGIDERSYKRGHRYLTLVVDHDRGRVVWAREGRSAETVGAFFDALGTERTKALRLVTMDMAQAYIQSVQERAPKAEIVFDRFHVQRLAHDALDEVRRSIVRTLADEDEARAVKRTRWALQKNPENLSPAQVVKLSDVQRQNKPLYRAYLLKETLRDILDHASPVTASQRLGAWTSWATRSRLAPFKKASKTIRRYRDGILAYIRTGLSNGRTEGMNNKLRSILARSYGLHSAGALVAYVRLCCSGLVLQPVRRALAG